MKKITILIFVLSLFGIYSFGGVIPSYDHNMSLNQTVGLHSEDVIPASGTVNFSQNLISIPGRGGLDFNLNLNYNSGIWSRPGGVTPNGVVYQYSGDYGYSSWEILDHQIATGKGNIAEMSSLGYGWSLSIPELYLVTNPANTNPLTIDYDKSYLKLEDGSKHSLRGLNGEGTANQNFQISSDEVSASVQICGFAEASDLPGWRIIFYYTIPQSGQNYLSAQVVSPDGAKYRFTRSNFMVIKSNNIVESLEWLLTPSEKLDKASNVIKYHYYDGVVNGRAPGIPNSARKIYRIEDTIGNELFFEYNTIILNEDIYPIEWNMLTNIQGAGHNIYFEYDQGSGNDTEYFDNPIAGYDSRFLGVVWDSGYQGIQSYSFLYDSYGLLRSRISPFGGEIQYEYENVGGGVYQQPTFRRLSQKTVIYSTPDNGGIPDDDPEPTRETEIHDNWYYNYGLYTYEFVDHQYVMTLEYDSDYDDPGIRSHVGNLNTTMRSYQAVKVTNPDNTVTEYFQTHLGLNLIFGGNPTEYDLFSFGNTVGATWLIQKSDLTTIREQIINLYDFHNNLKYYPAWYDEGETIEWVDTYHGSGGLGRTKLNKQLGTVQIIDGQVKYVKTDLSNYLTPIQIDDYGFVMNLSLPGTSGTYPNYSGTLTPSFDKEETNGNPEITTNISYAYENNYNIQLYNLSNLQSLVEKKYLDENENEQSLSKYQVLYDQADHFQEIDYDCTPSSNYLLNVRPGFPTESRVYYDIENNNYLCSETYYDQYMNPVSIVEYDDADPNHVQTVEYGYNCIDDLSRISRKFQDIVDASGTSIELSEQYLYDSFGNISRFTGANGKVTTIEYDVYNRVTSIQYPDDEEEEPSLSISYSQSGTTSDINRAAVTKIGQSATYHFYDDFGRYIQSQQIIDDRMEISGFVYNWDSQKKYSWRKQSVNSTDVNIPYDLSLLNGRSRYFYDYQSRLEKIIYPDGSFSEWEFLGNQITSYEPTELEVIADYTVSNTDWSNRQVEVVRNDDGHELTTSFDYDPLGNMRIVTDPRQLLTIHDFDDVGRLKSNLLPDREIQNMKYHHSGQVLEHEEAFGRNSVDPYTINYDYDNLSRRTRSYIQDYIYDSYTVQSYSSDYSSYTSLPLWEALFPSTLITHDGKQLNMKDENDAVIVRAFIVDEKSSGITEDTKKESEIKAPAGDITGTVDWQEWQDLNVEYTLEVEKDGIIHIVRMAVIDIDGNLTTVSQEVSKTSSGELNLDLTTGLVNLKFIKSIEMSVDIQSENPYQYQLFISKLIAHKTEEFFSGDREQHDKENYSYDSYATIDVPPGFNIDNPKGNLVQVEEISGTTQFYYDDRGRISEQVQNVSMLGSKPTKFSYNKQDQVTNIIYPDGSLVEYNYNVGGELERVSDIVSQIEYYSSNRISSVNFTNGVQNHYAYNTRNAIHNWIVQDALNVEKVNETYGYFPDHNLETITDNIGGELSSFQYDGVNRLVEVNYTGSQNGRREYGYDDNGNRIFSEIFNGETLETQSYIIENESNRLMGIVASDYIYEYDANGNLSLDYHKNHNYLYDWQNRLYRVESDDAVTEFSYNYRGQRVRKIHTPQNGQPVETFYIYAGDDIIAEYDGFGILQNKFIYGNGQRLAKMTRNISPWEGFDIPIDNTDYWYDGHQATVFSLVPTGGMYSEGQIDPHPYVLATVDPTEDIYYEDGTYRFANIGFQDFQNIDRSVNGFLHLYFMPLNEIKSMSFNIYDQNFNDNEGRFDKIESNFFGDGDFVAGVDFEYGKWNEVWLDLNRTDNSEDGQSEDIISQMHWHINYVDGSDEIFEVGIDHMFATDKPFTTTYFHNDYLGSARVLTDDSGNVMWKRNYYPFGQDRTVVGTGNDYKFTGKEQDEETDFDYSWHRYYDNENGRFTQIDRMYIKSLGISPYVYALNNPLKFIDDTGDTVVVSVSSMGAQGNGHTTLYFQDADGNWYSYDQGATGVGSSLNGEAGVNIVPVLRPPKSGLYRVLVNGEEKTTSITSLVVSTAKEQDSKVFQQATISKDAHNSGELKYRLLSNNCTDSAVDVVRNAGISISNEPMTVRPNSWVMGLKDSRTEIQTNNSLIPVPADNTRVSIYKPTYSGY